MVFTKWQLDGTLVCEDLQTDKNMPNYITLNCEHNLNDIIKKDYFLLYLGDSGDKGTMSGNDELSSWYNGDATWN